MNFLIIYHKTLFNLAIHRSLAQFAVLSAPGLWISAPTLGVIFAYLGFFIIIIYISTSVAS